MLVVLLLALNIWEAVSLLCHQLLLNVRLGVRFLHQSRVVLPPHEEIGTLLGDFGQHLPIRDLTNGLARTLLLHDDI